MTGRLVTVLRGDYEDVVPPPASNLRPQIVGLMDRRESARNSQDWLDLVQWPGYGVDTGGFVLEADWSDLQPTQGGALDTTELARLRTVLDDAETKNLGVRLRVFAGRYAPSWAKSINGFTPLDMYSADDTPPAPCGPWWRQDYVDALIELIERLSDWVEAEPGKFPALREIVNGLVMTVYAEPFIRGYGVDPDSYRPEGNEAARKQGWYADIAAAGYTSAQDEAAMNAMILPYYEQFIARHGIRVYVAHNPFQFLTPNGGNYQFQQSISFATDYIAAQRALSLQGHVIGNNSNADHPTDPSNPFDFKGSSVGQIFEAMAGGPSSCQTATLETMSIGTHASKNGTPYGAVADMAVVAGCAAVEMPGSPGTATSGEWWGNPNVVPTKDAQTAPATPPEPNNSPTDQWGVTSAQADTLTGLLVANL